MGCNWKNASATLLNEADWPLKQKNTKVLMHSPKQGTVITIDFIFFFISHLIFVRIFLYIYNQK